jgi:hypothetical protein
MASSSSTAAGVKTILHLYRSILRMHRHKLPGDMRELGDDYVRSEFIAHLRGKNPPSRAQWLEFVSQWRGYVAMLSGDGAHAAPSSGGLSSEELALRAEQLNAMLSPEQVLRIEALKKEAGGLGASIRKQSSKDSGAVQQAGSGTAGPLQ